MQPTLADLFQILIKGHAAIDNHRRARPLAGALFQCIQHLVQAAAVLHIAVEDFVRFGKPVTIQHQSDDDLFAVGPLVAGISSLGLWVRFRLSFEIGRGQVIQIDSVVQIEQRLFLLRQCALDMFAVRMQPVQIPV